MEKSPLVLEKARLRQQLLKQRSALPADQRQQWDEEITEKLWNLPAYQRATSVMTYLSFGDEFNTWPIFEALLVEGKEAIVPKIKKRPKEIVAVRVRSKDELKPGLWGIQEPITEDIVDPGSIDLIIVPGLAFDQQFYRLGYGGGYYDRFLPQTQGLKVGLVYNLFIMDVPKEPWDQPVDLLITNS